MKEKHLKIADIARLAELSRSDARDYARSFDTLIPSRKLGRIRIYEENAVPIFRNISALIRQGYDQDQIRKELKPGAQRKPQKMLKRQVPPSPQPAQAFSDSPRVQKNASPTIRGFDNGRALNAMKENDAMQDRQIGQMKARIEELEKKLEEMNCTLSLLTDRLNQSIESQQKQLGSIGEWIDYFETRSETREKADKEYFGLIRERIDFFEREILEMKSPLWERVRRKFG
jgi:DNA-binding transcriptional MerR regulator